MRFACHCCIYQIGRRAEDRFSESMYIISCRECGASLRRAKRRSSERFWHLEAYRCQGCSARYYVTLGSRLKLARWAKSPRCRFQGVRARRRVDNIDRKRGGIFNLLHRMLGGQLYHCWFCRLQFYDLRPRKENPNWHDDWLRGGNSEQISWES